ncbi:hypothetical protein V1291_000700 [Nitrobacteraceae bacterium AZCC 1564]
MAGLQGLRFRDRMNPKNRGTNLVHVGSLARSRALSRSVEALGSSLGDEIIGALPIDLIPKRPKGTEYRKDSLEKWSELRTTILVRSCHFKCNAKAAF